MMTVFLCLVMMTSVRQTQGIVEPVIPAGIEAVMKTAQGQYVTLKNFSVDPAVILLSVSSMEDIASLEIVKIVTRLTKSDVMISAKTQYVIVTISSVEAAFLTSNAEIMRVVVNVWSSLENVEFVIPGIMLVA